MNYEYKNSGIEWIGNIPTHWKIEKFPNYVSFQEGPGILGQDFRDEGIPLIRISGVKTNITTLEGCNYLDPIMVEKKWNHFRLNSGDLLISCSASTGLISEVTDETVGAIPYTGLIRLTPSYGKILKDFIRVFISSTPFLYQIDLQKKGTTIEHYGPTHLQRMLIIVPSKPEQEYISKYLDKACSDIDRVIEIKRKQIENLQQQLKSIIHKAVTKGLDDNVEMKESRIDWIGDVPKHWKINRIKSIASLQSGENITSDIITNFDEYPVYGGNGLRGYYSQYTHEGIFALIGRQGALCGNINYASGRFWASEHAVVATPIKITDTFWLGETLRIMNLNQYSNSAAQPGLAVEKIRNLYMPIPPYSEQTVISDFIRNYSEKLNLVRTNIETQIETLLSYKKSLIHEVVTGKKQVYSIN